MLVTGIVAEFNPFHNGHKYLLMQASGLKVVAMSGNFVQRGEPAILDKWIRAQMALKHGADIVVELPFLVAIQSADQFAQGAVDILHRLGINQLVFGTEEFVDYNQLVGVYQEKSNAMESYIKSLAEELSYPKKVAEAWREFGGISAVESSSNHILGLSYVKAVSNTDISLKSIQRIGAGFHSEEKVEIASATAIRKHCQDHSFIRLAMPESRMFLNSPRQSWDNYFEFLKYQIISNDDLTQFIQINEELAHRIKNKVKSASNIEELVTDVSTKRFTNARVRRALTYILVGAKENSLPEGIRILGFSEEGREHLKSIKKSVPLVTRIGKLPWDVLSQKADSIYQLGNPKVPEQNFARIPIILK